jgi:hypothetical protein
MNTFYLIDLDFTLFNTRLGSSLVIKEVERLNPEVAHRIEERLADYSARGASFAIRDQIVELGGEALAAEVETRFITSASQQNMLIAGAAELIDFMTRRSLPFGILTYGSAPGQIMKINSAGLGDVPFLVTDQMHKGELISSWWTGDHFHLPRELGGGAYDHLVFVDDRLFSFTGLPGTVTGYWVQTGPIRDDPGEPTPQNVRPVATLTEVISLEQARLTIDKA